MPKDETQTVGITNFGGRLTRILNGDMNSGMAKFVPSFGYDPFSKPQNLTWLEQPTSVISSSTTNDIVLAGKARYEPAVPYIYTVSGEGTLRKIQPNQVLSSSFNASLDTSSVIGKLTNNSPTFAYGASMDFFGNTSKIYVGNDTQINSVNFDGSGDAKVGTTGYSTSSYRPLQQFAGKLLFGNGNTIGAIDSTGTVTSSIIGTGQGNLYSELNPALPVEAYVQDLDISPDFNYALITASLIRNEALLTAANDTIAGTSSTGLIFNWNGSDATVTAGLLIPSYAVTALLSYLNNNYLFSNDSFGGTLSQQNQKLLSLQGNKSPSPNAVIGNGNFLSWIVPEVNSAGTGVNASLYYFGSLDQENPAGLYRLLRYSPVSKTYVPLTSTVRLTPVQTLSESTL